MSREIILFRFQSLLQSCIVNSFISKEVLLFISALKLHHVANIRHVYNITNITLVFYFIYRLKYLEVLTINISIYIIYMPQITMHV